MNHIKKLSLAIFSSFLLSSFAYANTEKAKLSILSTTDIHAYIMNYNYYQDMVDGKVGLNKLSTLIQEIRSKNPNTLLFDNGDLVQGNPLADYIVENYNLKTQKHPILRIMEHLQYDAIAIGNHEFNYGLDVLDGIIANTTIPVLSSNVMKNDGKHKFTPYVIIDKTITTDQGNTKNIKVGVTSAVPPQIMMWDKSNLNGKVKTQDIVTGVKNAVEELQKKKVDFIVVLSHSGIGKYESKYKDGTENAAYEISKIEGVDFVISGHEHKRFPVKGQEKQHFVDDSAKNVSNQTGKINNAYVVMPDSYAKVLGVFDVTLALEDNKWSIENVDVSLQTPKAIDTTINTMIRKEHDATVSYINSRIGSVNGAIDNYFARVQEDFSIEFVNQAQIWYAEKLKNNVLAKYKNLPVVSSMSPFKNGGRGGSSSYTNVRRGNISIKNAVDLYVYPNTAMVLKVSGKELREYLEWSVQSFNNLEDTAKEQYLVNEDIASYNYDVVDGVFYTIDLTKKNRYEGDKIVNASSNRITELKYNGKDVKDNDEFLLITNNYRANTSSIINKNSKNVVFDSQIQNRNILIDYIKEKNNIINQIDNNITVIYPKNTNLVFESSKKAQSILRSDSKIEYLRDTKDGFALYRVKNN